MKTTMRRAIAGWLGACALMGSGIGGACAATPAEEVQSHVKYLREIRADDDNATIARHNRQMDAGWAYFKANKPQVLPLLREQLDQELRAPQRNGMVLLDLGDYLTLNGIDDADRDKGAQALAAIDPKDPVVDANVQQLFEFARLVAARQDVRAFPLIDRAFLRKDVQLFVPQHAMKLESTLASVFLYGPYGERGETHLRELLRVETDPAIARRIIEILIWIGSSASVPEIKRVGETWTDYETFGRVMTFMMMSGGPDGPAALREVRMETLDDKAQAYWTKQRGDLDHASFATWHSLMPKSELRASSAELARRTLAQIEQRKGVGAEAPPFFLVDAPIPAPEIIASLTRSRALVLQRLSDEALSEVRLFNLLINTLRYRQLPIDQPR